MLFSLSQGKSRLVPLPSANAFAIIRATKIVPGNAMTQPSLIGRVQGQFQQGASQEYALQFLAAVQAEVRVKRNEAAISATRQRLVSPTGAAQ
jgi:peptidyl-prolyl cis-trans isomerase D